MRKILVALLILSMLIAGALGEMEWNVEQAVEVLKAYWRDEVYEGFATDAADGYLEIKNTRVVVIQKEPEAADAELQEYADRYFGDVAYIVEFLLYTDVLGIAPYYHQTGEWDCVVVHEDGSMEVPAEHPFDAYRSRTYSMDFSGILAEVIDLGQAYNAVYHLNNE